MAAMNMLSILTGVSDDMDHSGAIHGFRNTVWARKT